MSKRLSWGQDIVEDSRAQPGRLFALSLLGQFDLRDARSGGGITITSRKARCLLAYLSMAPRFAVDRTTLAALLWGDSNDDQARQSLRQSLSSLRRVQIDGTALLSISEDVITLNRDAVDVDCLTLLQLPLDAEISALARGCDNSRGSFGAGLEIGVNAFDEWLRGERQRLLDRSIVLHDRLVDALDADGRPQQALHYANALLALNPLREETHRQLIALEAKVSGRAAAMQRYESFRQMLRDELAVRPEPATVRLIDQLRQKVPEAADNEILPAATLPPSSLQAKRPVRLLIAATFALLLMAAVAGVQRLHQPSDRTADDIRYGRALVALATDDDPALAVHLRETESVFARNKGVTLVDLAQTRRPDYRVKLRLADAAQRIAVSITRAGTEREVWTGSIPLEQMSPTSFARELYGYVTSEIVLSEARRQATSDTLSSKLWRAQAGQLQTRLGTQDLGSVGLYEEVLAQDPGNTAALRGLADFLILRVARNQSPHRASDLERITDLLIRLKPLVPNSADIAFKQGMLNKLQGNFEQASRDFEYAVRLDPAHWNAAAQYAHIEIFLGRLAEGFQLMEAATPNLLPDLGAAETAYIAGETALVSRHYPEAVRYLAMAVSGNPTVGRIQALYAVALYMAGRQAEADAANRKARELSPGYTPEVLGQRGGRTAHPHYAAARDELAEVLRKIRASN